MNEVIVPRTATDTVFDQLHSEIVSLTLLPGTKISEADVAARMGVSRQPVRDAFNRLAHQGLLSIRPQRATVVRGFSRDEIANARFIRLAVELEVLRLGHPHWNTDKAAALSASLDAQRAAIDAGEVGAFHAMDYAFHKLIFELCDRALAYEIVVQSKQQVDRLCVLSLKDAAELEGVFADHVAIADALANGGPGAPEEALRVHTSRLDSTIAEIQETHADYFE